MEKALEHSRRAVELEPLVMLLRGHEFYFLAIARRPDELLERASKAAELDPHFWLLHTARGLALQLRGQLPEAILEFERANEASGGLGLTLQDLAYAYALAGRREDAERMMAESRQRGYTVSVRAGAIHAALGEREEAFEAFEQGYLERNPSLLYLKTWFWYDDLRADPRYHDLVRRVGLP
jgi:tetratricopeptide (TPR) repeat protein